MKMHKLIPLVVFAITIPVLSGCDQKIKRDSFLEIFEGNYTSRNCDYYFEDDHGNDVWLNDYDSYVSNELKKLNAKKRYTKPTNIEKWFVYNIYGSSTDGNYLTSQIKFYDNGSIIVNEYGSHIADSYNFFTIPQEEATALFKFAEDRFTYAEQVLKEDFLTTKNEKGIDAFIDALETQTKIPGGIYDKGKTTVFEDDGRLLTTLRNIEYTYFDTTDTTDARDYNKVACYYNIKNLNDYENDSWFFVLSRNYTQVSIINHMRYDRAGHDFVMYANIYNISREAGIAIVEEMYKIASSVQ